jgi:2-polyprenyl-3-methyl-5-hydroxy-6-metoxy-1,4-benzoquinol methylase
VRAAIDAGFDAEGVDISEPAVECGKRQGLRLYALDVLRQPVEGKFDVVTMWATLEHVPNPVAHLRRAIELVADGGLLFVSVPNFDSMTQNILGRWDRYVGNDHLNYFTPRLLTETLTHLGLKHGATTTYGFNPVIIARDWRNRGTHNLTVEDMHADQAVTLRTKQSPLIKLQGFCERVLDVFSLGDCVAVCCSK